MVEWAAEAAAGATAADMEVATVPVGSCFPEVGKAVVPSWRDLELETVPAGTESEIVEIVEMEPVYWPFAEEASNMTVFGAYFGEA